MYPSISVAPESLNEELYIGETSVGHTITNNGNSDLDWTSSLGDDATFGGSWPGESQSRDALSISEVVNRFNGRVMSVAMMRGRSTNSSDPNHPLGGSLGTNMRTSGPGAVTVQGEWSQYSFSGRGTGPYSLLVLFRCCFYPCWHWRIQYCYGYGY